MNSWHSHYFPAALVLYWFTFLIAYIIVVCSSIDCETNHHTCILRMPLVSQMQIFSSIIVLDVFCVCVWSSTEFYRNCWFINYYMNCRRKQLYLHCHRLHMEHQFSWVTGATFFSFEHINPLFSFHSGINFFWGLHYELHLFSTKNITWKNQMSDFLENYLLKSIEDLFLMIVLMPGKC